MKDPGISTLRFGFILLILLIALSSCDKEEIVLPDKEPLDTSFSIDADDFSVPADSTTMSVLDSSINLGYTYSRILSISARIQINLAGSLSSMSNAAAKITPDIESKDQERKGSFLKEIWKSIAALLT